MDVDDYIRLKLTHSLHTSERLSFRGCRRRWSWLFRDGWYPVTTAKPLEFGSAFHAAMEQWYDPFTWGKDNDTRLTLALLAFNRMCQEQKAEYLKRNDGNIDEEVERDFEERRELGEGMIRYHCGKVSPRLDVGFTPVQVEIEFEVPIRPHIGLSNSTSQTLGPINDEVLWCKCDRCRTLWRNSEVGMQWHSEWQERFARSMFDAGMTREEAIAYVNAPGRWIANWKGLPVTYGGRIDMLAQDEHGQFWIFDWKTAARLSGQEEQDSPDEFVLLDDQITSYLWALWSLGMDVAGFVHHEMKKAFPVEPEPNKQQRKGCWYSVNKNQNVSYDLYVETISEGDPYGLASGAYDEFLAWLKTEGPRFHSRKQVARSETELANAGYNIYLEALDMIDPGLRIYPSPGRFACSFCAFRQPCIGTNRDEDIEYMLMSNFDKRDTRYWEKTKPSTDSKGGQ